MSKRGIVLCPPFEIINGGFKINGGGPDAFELRKYLLYWDELDYPNNNHIRTGTGNDFEFLIEAKVAKRTEVVFPGGLGKVEGIGHRLTECQQQAFLENNKREPGAWSFAHLSTTPYFTEITPSMALELELYNMLPVPKKDIPLNDILEFKQKRRSELIALRTYLDDLYLKLNDSPDILRTRNSIITRVEQGLKDVDDTLSESKITTVLSSLRCIIGKASGEIGEISTYVLSSVLDPSSAVCIGRAISLALKCLPLPEKTKEGHQPLVYAKSVKQEWGSN